MTHWFAVWLFFAGALLVNAIGLLLIDLTFFAFKLEHRFCWQFVAGSILTGLAGWYLAGHAWIAGVFCADLGFVLLGRSERGE